MTERVLLADDHVVVRQGLRALLELRGLQVVGEASDGKAAVELARQLQPDVAVLDIVMPVLNGIEAAHQIGKLCPSTRVILLTVHQEEQYVLAAIRDGVRGYVVKTQAADDLFRAIHDVCQGRIYASPHVAQTVMGIVQRGVQASSGGGDTLTRREREVLQLVAEGKGAKQIAGSLKISAKTAEFHRSRLMAKLGVHDTAGLVRYAIRRGFIEA